MVGDEAQDETPEHDIEDVGGAQAGDDTKGLACQTCCGRPACESPGDRGCPQAGHQDAKPVEPVAISSERHGRTNLLSVRTHRSPRQAGAIAHPKPLHTVIETFLPGN